MVSRGGGLRNVPSPAVIPRVLSTSPHTNTGPTHAPLPAAPTAPAHDAVRPLPSIKEPVKPTGSSTNGATHPPSQQAQSTTVKQDATKGQHPIVKPHEQQQQAPPPGNQTSSRPGGGPQHPLTAQPNGQSTTKPPPPGADRSTSQLSGKPEKPVTHPPPHQLADKSAPTAGGPSQNQLKGNPPQQSAATPAQRSTSKDPPKSNPSANPPSSKPDGRAHVGSGGTLPGNPASSTPGLPKPLPAQRGPATKASPPQAEIRKVTVANTKTKGKNDALLKPSVPATTKPTGTAASKPPGKNDALVPAKSKLPDYMSKVWGGARAAYAAIPQSVKDQAAAAGMALVAPVVAAGTQKLAETAGKLGDKVTSAVQAKVDDVTKQIEKTLDLGGVQRPTPSLPAPLPEHPLQDSHEEAPVQEEPPVHGESAPPEHETETQAPPPPPPSSPPPAAAAPAPEESLPASIPNPASEPTAQPEEDNMHPSAIEQPQSTTELPLRDGTMEETATGNPLGTNAEPWLNEQGEPMPE